MHVFVKGLLAVGVPTALGVLYSSYTSPKPEDIANQRLRHKRATEPDLEEEALEDDELAFRKSVFARDRYDLPLWGLPQPGVKTSKNFDRRHRLPIENEYEDIEYDKSLPYAEATIPKDLPAKESKTGKYTQNQELTEDGYPKEWEEKRQRRDMRLRALHERARQRRAMKEAEMAATKDL
mmetsp:Transcript_28265/g.31400  ORF Transcript_28265/g.31400 Transcript_28265/m.31400 type:complete len:180 (-) Transcript_28265:93-632(-)